MSNIAFVFELSLKKMFFKEYLHARRYVMLFGLIGYYTQDN